MCWIPTTLCCWRQRGVSLAAEYGVVNSILSIVKIPSTPPFYAYDKEIGGEGKSNAHTYQYRWNARVKHDHKTANLIWTKVDVKGSRFTEELCLPRIAPIWSYHRFWLNQIIKGDILWKQHFSLGCCFGFLVLPHAYKLWKKSVHDLLGEICISESIPPTVTKRASQFRRPLQCRKGAQLNITSHFPTPLQSEHS